MNKIGFVLLACLMLILPITGAVAQESVTIPQLNIIPKTLPDTEGIRFVKDMELGWSLGNTFDAFTDSPWFSDELDYESAWCGIKTTEAMLVKIKEAGFETLRIPVSWHDHVSGDMYQISERWLARVKEIVAIALKLDFKVILNTHHDCAKGYYYPDSENIDTSINYISHLWMQLADAFNEFDDNLLFEGLNEPRLAGTKFEWNLFKNNDTCFDAVECINQLNQAFVDVVRRSGGNNANRFLLIAGYAASLDGATYENFRMPTDTASDRLILSVHAYTPYPFALQSPSEDGSTAAFSVESKIGIADVSYLMNTLYDKFVSQGVPVLLGEFGSRDKGGNLQSRVDHAAYYIACARANGITCCWWDNNVFSGNGERFGLFDRKNLNWPTPEIVEALTMYAK